MKQDALATRFREFDAEHFDGELSSGTAVAWDSRLASDEYEDGACKKDGSAIFLNPRDPNWECTLLHEMVHAFEYRFPNAIVVTEDGQKIGRQFKPLTLMYGQHSEKFFSKLVEIMRQRGHDPYKKPDFIRYFG